MNLFLEGVEMMSKTNLKVLFLLMTAAMLLAQSASGQTYTIKDLGALKPGSARVHDVNSQNQVVGASGAPHGSNTHAFFWSQQGGMRDLGFLSGGDYSVANAINDAGQVVGVSNTRNSIQAFLWTSANGLTRLATLLPGDASTAYGINQSGQIAGRSGAHAVLWNGSSVKDLGTLGGAKSEAHGINSSLQVVGVADTKTGHHAFLWTNTGPMQDLGTLPGDSGSRANHINDSGAVVGASEGFTSVRAFYWTSTGGMQEIGVLQGGGYSEAYGINNSGQVVGQSGSVLGTRAFFWKPGGSIVDLNDLVSQLPVGTILTGAFAITDKGQIAAFGVVNPKLNPHRAANMDDHLHSGPTHVFLLTPVAVP